MKFWELKDWDTYGNYVLQKEQINITVYASKVFLKKCAISLYKDEKGMPFMNFKIVNAKNKKMEFKKLLKYSISIHWGFNH